MRTTHRERGSHVAVRCGRFLLIFGGAAGNVLSDTDVHCFDTRTYKWIKITTEIVNDGHADEDKKLTKIAPRAGHCATTSENCTKMFICGGGDNQSALLETLSLDCSELAKSLRESNATADDSSSPPKLTWSLLVKSSILTGKEGMTLTTIPCQSGNTCRVWRSHRYLGLRGVLFMFVGERERTIASSSSSRRRRRRRVERRAPRGDVHACVRVGVFSFVFLLLIYMC